MSDRRESEGLLPPRVRSAVRGWADRPPRRDADTAAALARAATARSGRHPVLPRPSLAVDALRRWRSGAVPRPRLLWGALAAGVVVLAIALILPRPGANVPASPRRAPLAPAGRGAAAAAPVETRVVVIELASGTSLYVVLPPPAARRSS